MNIIKTNIDGVLIIEPRLFRDARGYFFESFSEREFEEKIAPILGHCVHFCQDNESMSSYGAKLSRIETTDRETGGSMLNVTGLNQFYYLCDFTDMRCKHSRVLSIIHEQLHHEPNDGDVSVQIICMDGLHGNTLVNFSLKV